MSGFYLDPSFLVCLFVRQRNTESAERWMRAAERSLIVSDFAAAEVSSAMSRLVRQRDLTDDEANQVLIRFDRWETDMTMARLTLPSDITGGKRIVRNFALKLLVPDALHIAMALADGATLVTFDERQAEAMAQLGDCVVPR